MQRTALLIGMACALPAVLLSGLPAKAARIATGTSCSLAEAIESANTNAAVAGCTAGVVGFDRVVVTSDVTLTSANNGVNGLPVIVEDLEITSGAPGAMRFITRSFLVGTPEFRMLEIGTAAVAPVVTIKRLTLNNGRVSGPIGIGGGCIFLRNGSLTIRDSILQECVAAGADNVGGDGASARGGAVQAIAGSLRITGSSFSLNRAIGGATTLADAAGGLAEGGAIQASGLASFEVEESVFDSNFALGGAGIGRGGVAKGGALVFHGVTGSIAGTSFSANAASGGVASNGTSGFSLGGALVTQGAALTITGSELVRNVANGQDSVMGTGGYAYGAGVYAAGGTLELQATDVSHNRASGGAGATPPSDGLARGGGLYLQDSTATIESATIASNSITGADPLGGAIAVLQDGAAATSLLVVSSTLADNVATATSGSANGGAIYQEGDIVTLRNTTISGNAADDGGGLYQNSGTTVARLSTISGNTAGDDGGGVAVDSAGLLGHAIDLINVTVSGNSAGGAGGGIYVTGTPLAPAVTAVGLYNTVVTENGNGGIHLAEGLTRPELLAGNSIVGGQASGADCSVSGTVVITSLGGNLESGTDCAFADAADQQSVADLGLAALGPYGGGTESHDLLPDSPAIDAGKAAVCNRQANGKDQPGRARFYDGNGDRDFACDSGSVEYQGLLANPGFEEPLDPATDWLLTASGGGDGRARSSTTPSGKFSLVFQANAALETVIQTVPMAGAAGDSYVMTLLGSGSGLTVGEAMTVTLESMAGGTVADSRTCTIRFASTTLAGARRCELATTAAHDDIRVTVGWDGATTGSIALDALSLTRREAVSLTLK